MGTIANPTTFPRFCDLLLPAYQSTLVQRRRAELMVGRVRTLASIFAGLAILSVPVDFYIFDLRAVVWICLLRLVVAGGFLCLAASFRNCDRIAQAYGAFAVLILCLTVLFLGTLSIMARFPPGQPLQAALAGVYVFMPFLMVTGISGFPVTASEGVVLSLPILLAYPLVSLAGLPVTPFTSEVLAQLLLIGLSLVATVGGMSQLHFMIQLVGKTSHDGLTQAYTRRIGEELLDVQFAFARKTKTPFALAFIDLDDFKRINDDFGHEQGDQAIRQAAQALRTILRRADLLVRWGGEEFLVVMPMTDLKGVSSAMQRLMESGLGARPDGTPLTASVGVAERIADGCDNWMQLVEKADLRMYLAKQNGKDRIVVVDDCELV